jgi:hypothetical protein
MLRGIEEFALGGGFSGFPLGRIFSSSWFELDFAVEVEE